MHSLTSEQWDRLQAELREMMLIANSLREEVGNEASIELHLRLEHLCDVLKIEVKP